MRITRVSLENSSLDLRERGLRGWVSIVIDGRLKLDGVTLPRTAAGRFALSSPACREIENAILTALGLEEVPQ